MLDSPTAPVPPLLLTEEQHAMEHCIRENIDRFSQILSSYRNATVAFSSDGISWPYTRTSARWFRARMQPWFCCLPSRSASARWGPSRSFP